MTTILLGCFFGAGAVRAGEWDASTSGFAALRQEDSSGVDALQTSVRLDAPLTDGTRQSLYLDAGFRGTYLSDDEDRLFGKLELFSGELYRQADNPDPLQNRTVFESDPFLPAGESDLEATWQASHFLREAYLWGAPWTGGAVELSAGKKRRTVGGGLVLDDYLTGADGVVHLWPESFLPLDVSLEWTKVDPGIVYDPARHSTLTTLEATLPFSRFEDVHLWYALFLDGDGNLAGVLNPILAPAFTRAPLPPIPNPLLSSRGRVHYGGVGLTRLFGDFFVDADLVVEEGSADLVWQPVLTQRLQVPRRLGTEGAALDASVDWAGLDWIRPGAFVVYMTGQPGTAEDVLLHQQVEMFLGVLPYLTRTNLFFRGGLNQTFGNGTLSLAGIEGRGVVAPGCSLTVPLGDRGEVRASVAELRSATPASSGRTRYGTEVDLQGDLQVVRHVSLLAEADRMDLGDFPFPEPIGVGGGSIPLQSPVLRILAGVDLQW